MLLVIGGVGLGGVAVGVCLLLLHFVIQPFSRPETRGYTTFQGEHFKLWYDDESERMDERSGMEASLEREYEDLLALMGVPESAIDGSMDVFIHDSIPQMQMSIMRRKSLTAGAVFNHPFDVLAGESPRRALAEVLLYYGWGGCHSPALYAGTVEYLTDPQRSYLSIIRAAPAEMTHSINDLSVLEYRGSFPSTMYRQLTGPTATTAIMDLLTIRIFFSVPESLAEAQQDQFHVLEMAALVEFLVEQRGGMQTLAQGWGPGVLGAILQRVDEASSSDELDVLWQAAIESQGDVAAVAPVLRVELLLEGGFSERAYELIRSWDSDPNVHTSVECAVAARCALAVGEFDSAGPWVEGLDERIRGEYDQLLQLFGDWERRETSEFVVVAPRQGLEEAFSRLEEGYSGMCERTDSSLAASSGIRPIFFVHPDEASCMVGKQLASANPTTVSAVHLTLDDDLQYTIVDLLLPRLWKWWPISPLVRLGTVTALVTPRDELISWATELACAGDWRRIAGLSVSSASDHLLRTEVGLLIAQVEEIGGIDAVRALWTAGREHGRISMEATLQAVVGSTTRELEDLMISEVIHCD